MSWFGRFFVLLEEVLFGGAFLSTVKGDSAKKRNTPEKVCFQFIEQSNVFNFSNGTHFECIAVLPVCVRGTPFHFSFLFDLPTSV